MKHEHFYFFLLHINELSFARFHRTMRLPRGHSRLAHTHLILLCALHISKFERISKERRLPPTNRRIIFRLGLWPRKKVGSNIAC